MSEENSNYLGYYLDDNTYIYSYLQATDIEINRIPRLGSVLGYAQAIIDTSEDSCYQVFDYINTCLDDDNKLTVVIKQDLQNTVPSSFFKVIVDAWVRMTQGTPEQVNFTFTSN